MTRFEAQDKVEEIREELGNVRLRPTTLVRNVHLLFRIQFALLDVVDALLGERDGEKAEVETGEVSQEQLVLVD